MAKYSFKVYLTDGSSKKIILSSLEKADLCDMDKFVCDIGGFFELCDYLADKLELDSKSIDKITILRNKKEVEFSLINSNSYLTPVLNDLKIKKIQGYGPYQIDAIVVSSSNPTYLEMNNYLFKNLRNDYEKFLNEVYTYDNEFSKLLNRYGNLYSQGINQEDEINELKQLEDRISLELRVYKNYRGMCKSRYNYERNNNRNINNLNVANVTDTNVKLINNNSTIYHDNTSNHEKFYESAIEYNQENEEFLDEEEYNDMVGDGNSYKRY